ncbi:MAG: type IV pilus secretin PilQ [Candidatus Aminicenantes bacterium]|nr:MAG: type IV pilus secretin PilQ [Candidatus Aminicenantes bacterium]
MKTKKYLQALSLLCILLLTSGFASNNESSTNINNISIEPGKLNTKIILEASSSLSIFNSHYSKKFPSTIVIDLDNVKTIQEPQFLPNESTLINGIKAEKIDTDKARILIDLKEKVPYRIISDKENTIIELNKIQKSPGDYILNPEIKKELEKSTKANIHLKEMYVSETKDRIDITARLSDEAISQILVLDNPLRLVVDLFDTLYYKPISVYPVNKLGIKKVRIAQFQVSNPYTITRIVFDITEPKFYTIDSSNEKMVFSFYKETAAQSVPVIGTPAPTDVKPNINEQSIPQKLEQPVIKEVKPNIKEKPVQEKKNQTTQEKIEPEKTTENKNIDPPKPIQSNKNVVSPSGNRTQEDQFKPRTIAEAEEKYSGDLISLRFKDADLRDVILYIGDHAGLNVVFDPEVRGVVTCNLQDVPWDQALDILIKNNKMGKIIEGNILRIAPIQVLMREQEDQRRLEESKELSGPILVKTYTLSYSKAGDVQGLLRSKISERGEIIVDGRTNTLIISDVKDRIDLLEKLIAVFDTPTPQVSIEARIVEATSTFIRNLGIQWGFRGISDPFYGNQTSLQFPHTAIIDGALIPQGIVTKGIGGPLGGYAVNLPAPAFTSALGISFSNVLDTFRLDMAISALETSGDGRIISSPTVTTQNNQEAEIIQGRQIPVQTVANFTVTTRYVNAALELRATPQITAEGTIIMHIEIQNNAADFANLVNGIPPITTQSATTTVMIPDGGTTVIGGIYRTEDSITRERVPFLHKIPILGNLFKSFARTKQTRELLIFITPRIIK